MFCPNCGKEVSEDTIYCPHCRKIDRLARLGKGTLIFVFGMILIVAGFLIYVFIEVGNLSRSFYYWHPYGEVVIPLLLSGTALIILYAGLLTVRVRLRGVQTPVMPKNHVTKLANGSLTAITALLIIVVLEVGFLIFVILTQTPTLRLA